MARILVIDDDAQVRSMVCRVLRSAKHDPIEASNGAVGMEFMRRMPPPALVITDIIMPGQEGIETIAAIREASGVPIIAISGSLEIGEFSPLLDAKLLGADVTIRKPFTAETLLNAVEQLIHADRGVEASMTEVRDVADGSPGPPVDVPTFEDELVFIVDDDHAVADSLGRFLTRSGFNTRIFTDPALALLALEGRLPRVMVVDKEMPGMSGFELADRVLKRDPAVRIIVVTGAGGESTAQAALRTGAADYLTKPVDVTELARSVQKALAAYAADEYRHEVSAWLREEVYRQSALNREIMLGTLASLVNALEARSAHFKGHSYRVAECASRIARARGLSEQEIAYVHAAGLLHDVGMIAVPDSLVQKPGALSREETTLIREHCRVGAGILEPLTHLGPAITFVLEHHERLDGSGYPEGKRASEISLGGQIVGLAEAWTALSEVRTYRDRISPADARGTLVAASGRWFAADLIKALFEAKG